VVQVSSFADLESLDQGEQTEFVHVPERLGPRTMLRCMDPPVERSDESMMKVRDGGDVPGVTC
jgi:hypothetical protein